MRRSIVLTVAAAVAFAPAATLAKPGPNGKNNHGMCTAYFAGSENGRANKRKAPPFAELERVSNEGAEEGSVTEDNVNAWCDANDPKRASGTVEEPPGDDGTIDEGTGEPSETSVDTAGPSAKGKGSARGQEKASGKPESPGKSGSSNKGGSPKKGGKKK